VQLQCLQLRQLLYLGGQRAGQVVGRKIYLHDMPNTLVIRCTTRHAVPGAFIAGRNQPKALVQPLVAAAAVVERDQGRGFLVRNFRLSNRCDSREQQQAESTQWQDAQVPSSS
jgi:hypothetical protein